MVVLCELLPFVLSYIISSDIVQDSVPNKLAVTVTFPSGKKKKWFKLGKALRRGCTSTARHVHTLYVPPICLECASSGVPVDMRQFLSAKFGVSVLGRRSLGVVPQTPVLKLRSAVAHRRQPLTYSASPVVRISRPNPSRPPIRRATPMLRPFRDSRAHRRRRLRGLVVLPSLARPRPCRS
jgi:hypothetical protein